MSLRTLVSGLEIFLGPEIIIRGINIRSVRRELYFFFCKPESFIEWTSPLYIGKRGDEGMMERRGWGEERTREGRRTRERERQ